MPVITAIPIELIDVLKAFGEDVKREIVGVVELDRIRVVRWGTGVSGVLSALTSAGIAHNTLAYNGSSSLPMWRNGIRFNHTGELEVINGWTVNSVEQEIVYAQLTCGVVHTSREQERSIWAASDLLCGPTFDSNQLENSKRHKLRSFLID